MYTPDTDKPRLKEHCVVANLHRIQKSAPFFLENKLHGELIRIVCRIQFLLPAISADLLSKVTVAVEETDTDEIETQVARRLQVIAGKYTQAARVNGE